MKLYRIKTRLIGHEFDEESIFGYVLAERNEDVFNNINRQLTATIVRRAIGDFESRWFRGNSYSQKFSWDDLGEVTPKEIATLRRLGILAAA